jgi:hypothetical protein
LPILPNPWSLVSFVQHAPFPLATNLQTCQTPGSSEEAAVFKTRACRGFVGYGDDGACKLHRTSIGKIASEQMTKRPRTEQTARPQEVEHVVESDLLNHTTNRGEDVIRIGTDEPDRANYEH